MSEEVGVLGSGGREFELGWQLARDDSIDTVYFLPGNAGTDDMPKGQNIAVDIKDPKAVMRFATEKDLSLVVVGPDAPLMAGVSDALREQKIPVFGPSSKAARLEGSKAFATEFMRNHNIEHPPALIVENAADALEALKMYKDGHVVIKADGLAEGKGVILPEDLYEAEIAVRELMIEGAHGGAGRERILLQERYHGPELSLFVVSDGTRIQILPYAQDHKRLYNGDHGPNTGGMGAYSPVSADLLTIRQEEKLHDIALRSIEGMSFDGTPYQGVLYIGIMLAQELGGDPAVIEYNARFGDPEAQVILPVLKRAGADITDLLRSAADGNLRRPMIPAKLGDVALTVILAANGYPIDPIKGDEIYGLDTEFTDVIIQHAGTAKQDGRIVTAGGRVLNITGLGPTHDAAAERAYGALEHVGFNGMQYRTDIGHQARTMQ
jgi:phosphoribosylamine--glycine ligase